MKRYLLPAALGMVQMSPLAQAEPKLGGTWTDPTTGMEFVYIPAGCFQMGRNDSNELMLIDQKPKHKVCVKGFIWASTK
jgi:formylglycine-generating enzyme required for sulfatase activity